MVRWVHDFWYHLAWHDHCILLSAILFCFLMGLKDKFWFTDYTGCEIDFQLSPDTFCCVAAKCSESLQSLHGSRTPPRSCTVVLRESTVTPWKPYTSTLMHCDVPRVYSNSMEAVHLHAYALWCSERLVTPWKMYTSTVLSTVRNQPPIF